MDREAWRPVVHEVAKSHFSITLNISNQVMIPLLTTASLNFVETVTKTSENLTCAF